MPKVTVVGAGHVGATTAQRIAEEGLADVAMVDIVEGLAQGKALDMSESLPTLHRNVKIEGSTDLSVMKDSDIVVVTAGVARKPGMSRDDLLEINTKIVGGIAEDIKKYARNAVVIVVTNPLDAMAYLTLKKTGFDSGKVIGMAGELDTARFRYFIAEEAGVAVNDIQTLILGGHGDSMVPLLDYTTINGIPIREFIKPGKLEELVDRAVNGGAEIVKHLKTGSAFYAPSAAITGMCRSILRDEKRIFCASAYLTGEYGHNDIYLGVPTMLGKNGVERIIEVSLNDADKQKLDGSATHVAENRDKLKL